MTIFNKIFVVLITIILGGIISNQIRFYRDRTVWQRLDYFPLPVENLIVLKPFGEEFWVEAKDGETYKIIYPCSEERACWEKSNDIPPSPPNGDYTDEDIHEYLFYDKSEGVCIDRFNISPFLGRSKNCITFVAKAESFYVFSLALDDKNGLWVWDNPWQSPYYVMGGMFSAILRGSLIGLVVGLLLIQILVKITGKKS